MKKIITIELLNKLANYMAQKPYLEVRDLINEMSQLPDYVNPVEEVKEKK